MWQCLQCNEPVHNNFSRCWNCGADKEGVADPEFMHADLMPVDHAEEVKTGLEESEYRVPQFSLSTLLLAFTCLCVIFAVLASSLADLFILMLILLAGAHVGLHASTFVLGLLSSWMRER